MEYCDPRQSYTCFPVISEIQFSPYTLFLFLFWLYFIHKCQKKKKKYIYIFFLIFWSCCVAMVFFSGLPSLILNFTPHMHSLYLFTYSYPTIMLCESVLHIHLYPRALASEMKSNMERLSLASLTIFFFISEQQVQNNKGQRKFRDNEKKCLWVGHFKYTAV